MRQSKNDSNPSKPARRHFLDSALKLGAASFALPGFARTLRADAPSPEVRPSELDEVTLVELQDGMKSGKFTARSLAERYLDRIAAIDTDGPALNSVIELNHDALTIADALDAERKSKGPRGPLHGIPVLIKDNIGTADRMMTTAGSLALLGFTPPKRIPAWRGVFAKRAR